MPIKLTRKLKCVASTSSEHMDCRAVSSSSLFAGAGTSTRNASQKVKTDHTFDFRFEHAEVALVDANEALLPFARPLDHLAYLFSLLFFGQGTDAVAGYDILEDGQLGEHTQFSDEHIIRDGLRVCGRRYRG